MQCHNENVRAPLNLHLKREENPHVLYCYYNDTHYSKSNTKPLSNLFCLMEGLNCKFVINGLNTTPCNPSGNCFYDTTQAFL